VTKRRAAAGLAAALALAGVLSLATKAPAHRTADGITGTAAAVGGGVDLHLTNNGSTTLLYDRGTLPGGKTLTGASQDGRACRISGSQFNCGPFSVPPGGAFTISLQSAQAPGPADGPFPLFVSSDGVTDSGPFSIPWQVVAPPPPPPPPAEPPCECAKIAIRTSNVSVLQRKVSFTLHWSLECTGGTGDDCSGHVEVASKTKRIRIVTPADHTVDCKGECGLTGRGAQGSARVTATATRRLMRSVRAGKHYEFTLNAFCDRDAGPRRVALRAVTLVFDKDGSLDRDRSDLNADNKADG
jgi:hypothetical protein